MRILIVDDSQTETQSFKDLLSPLEHEIMEASGGAQAVALVRDAQPDVVLMDIIMPGLNGFQATRQITKDPANKNVKIILVSSKDQATDRIWGEKQGAKGYLVKPINQQQLIDAINQVMED